MKKILAIGIVGLLAFGFLIGVVNVQGALVNVSSTVTVKITKIWEIDSIDLGSSADWFYGVRASNDGTSWSSIAWSSEPIAQDTATLNVPASEQTKSFSHTALASNSYWIYDEIVVLDNDLTSDDQADISGYVGAGGWSIDKNTAFSYTGAKIMIRYNVVDDIFYMKYSSSNEWGPYNSNTVISWSGEYTPDGSTAVDEDDAGITFTVYDSYSDDIPPTTTCTLSGTMGDNGWFTSNVAVTLSASDNSGGTGVKETEYMVNSGSWTTYSSPFTVSTAGTNTVYYRSYDCKNIENPVPQTDFKIDKAAPGKPSPSGPSGWKNDNMPSFSWSNPGDSTSGVAGYYWKVDSGGSDSWTASTSLALPSPVSDGGHTFYVKAKDYAGNVGSYGTCDFYVDTTPPTVAITYPLGGDVSGTVPVTADASDGSSSSGVLQVEFYLDNVLQYCDSATPYEWSWDTTTALYGSHTLKAVAYDAAGNQKDSAQVTVNVDNPVTEFSGAVVILLLCALMAIISSVRKNHP